MPNDTAALPDKQLFRVDEAAQYVRRTKQTVYNWCRDGDIRCVRIHRRGILIPRSAILEIIRFSSECYIKNSKI